MKKTITFYEFKRAFAKLRPDNFSDQGLEVLFNYLEEIEADTGEEIEFDVIALCCGFAEYSNIRDFNADYGTNYEESAEIEETSVIEIDDEAFIIHAF